MIGDFYMLSCFRTGWPCSLSLHDLLLHELLLLQDSSVSQFTVGWGRFTVAWRIFHKLTYAKDGILCQCHLTEPFRRAILLLVFGYKSEVAWLCA